MPAALSVTGLRKAYGSVQALRGIDLAVGAGELFGLLGPNGAGKSTLVKIACGLVRPSAGAVEVCGSPAGSAHAHAQLGYLAELFRFPDWCTAEELLGLHQELIGSQGGVAERRELLQLVELGDVPGRRVGAMSKGMQQRLGLAQALVGAPRLLLLDEPTSALDPAGRRTVRQLLERLRERGVSVLLNSHLLSEVELVCDRVAIIDGGEVVAAGTPAELSRAGGVEVETAAGVRTFPAATRADAPRIVRELVAAGEDVYSVRALSSTLEDAYLEAVGRAPVAGDETGGRGAADEAAKPGADEMGGRGAAHEAAEPGADETDGRGAADEAAEPGADDAAGRAEDEAA
jgi:ABC-2 type transport system ATP-binding protein